MKINVSVQWTELKNSEALKFIPCLEYIQEKVFAYHLLGNISCYEKMPSSVEKRFSS